MADTMPVNRVLLEALLSGLIETCQNIRLSAVMTESLLHVYDKYDELQVHRLCTDAFGSACSPTNRPPPYS